MADEPFRYLDASLLGELHQVIIASRCALAPLLSGIDPRFVASLEEHASGAAVLLHTLHRLNETRHLTGGEVPFELWLGNASALVGHLPEAAAVVERALGEVRRRRAVREEPVVLPPSGVRPEARPEPASSNEPSGESFLVIIHHPDALWMGERWVLTENLTRIGRSDRDVDWTIWDDSISRQHCQIERRGERWVLRDLGTTNGTWVNDERLDDKAEREIVGGDRIWLGKNVILRFLGDEGSSTNRSRTLFHSDPVDGLTGLLSRHCILETLDAVTVAAKRTGRELRVLAIHVDQMDRIDDDESEPVGDYVLQELARVLESTLRPGDIVGRLVGYAFLMVLPDTGSRQGREMAARVLSAVRSHAWYAEGERVQVTVSIGLAASFIIARSFATEALEWGGDRIRGEEIKYLQIYPQPPTVLYPPTS